MLLRKSLKRTTKVSRHKTSNEVICEESLCEMKGCASVELPIPCLFSTHWDSGSTVKTCQGAATAVRYLITFESLKGKSELSLLKVLKHTLILFIISL